MPKELADPPVLTDTMKLAHFRVGDDATVVAFHVTLEGRNAGRVTVFRRGARCAFDFAAKFGKVRLKQRHVRQCLRYEAVIVEVLLQRREIVFELRQSRCVVAMLGVVECGSACGVEIDERCSAPWMVGGDGALSSSPAIECPTRTGSAMCKASRTATTSSPSRLGSKPVWGAEE